MTDYVSDAQARSLILDVGRRLYHSGFVASNDGILHVRLEIMRSGLLLQAYPKVL